jgi:D-alanyl-D-alanine carboxypeptidase
VGTEIAVDVALRALIVKSANDVAIMLAEKIGGSEEGFVRLMNETAKRLGMTRTHFVNPNGLPVEGQVSTARDLARLARAAVLEFPEYNALWAMPEFQFGQQRLQSHNALLRTFEGADGIKTGFICDSGFNVVASATRDGQRLMAVVLGEPSGSDRNLRAASLLEHGFETSAWKAQFGAPTIDTMPIDPKAQVVRSVRKIARRKPKGVAQKAAGPRKAPPSKQVATPRPTGERNAKAAPAAKPQPTTKH